MYCLSCGTQLPDDATFCSKCGRKMANAPGSSAGSARSPPTPPTEPTQTGPLTCKACGAPLTPQPGEMVVTCEYCGSTVSLSPDGWKAIQNHSMLVPQVMDEQKALETCRAWLDKGLLHRHAFEDSKVKEAKISIVPYWIIPASAVTHYVYNDVAYQAAATGGSIAAAALIGGMLGGGNRGGGGMLLPMGMVMGMGMGGGMGQGAKRAAEIANQYEYPIIAVQGLQKYQPHDYQFALTDRVLYDKRKLPANAPVLNGDVGEDSAKYSAKSYITQLQGEKAHSQHRMVEKLDTEVNMSDGELLHVPIWYFTLERKGTQTVVLVDGHRMAVMNSAE
jgi:hypothetical protein